MPLREPITRNKLSFFETPAKKKSSKAQLQLSSMKSDCSLFSRLFIACQIRSGDLDEFFKHKNQACPPSIADDRHLRLLRQKSELASSLQLLTTMQEAPANSEVIVMDGAALVNMIKPSVEDKMFAGYAKYHIYDPNWEVYSLLCNFQIVFQDNTQWIIF